MDPLEKLTPNHHDGRSKHRLIDGVSSPNTPTITRLIGTQDHSPLAPVNVNLTQSDGPSQDDVPVTSVDTSSIAPTTASTVAASAPAVSSATASTAALAPVSAAAEQDSEWNGFFCIGQIV